MSQEGHGLGPFRPTDCAGDGTRAENQVDPGRGRYRLAARVPCARLHVAYSRPRPEDELGRHYDSAGRVDGALLEKLVPGLDGEFYLCGPTGFMASVQEHLEARGVPPERIRSETF